MELRGYFTQIYIVTKCQNEHWKSGSFDFIASPIMFIKLFCLTEN